MWVFVVEMRENDIIAHVERGLGKIRINITIIAAK